MPNIVLDNPINGSYLIDEINNCVDKKSDNIQIIDSDIVLSSNKNISYEDKILTKELKKVKFFNIEAPYLPRNNSGNSLFWSYYLEGSFTNPYIYPLKIFGLNKQLLTILPPKHSIVLGLGQEIAKYSDTIFWNHQEIQAYPSVPVINFCEKDSSGNPLMVYYLPSNDRVFKIDKGDTLANSQAASIIALEDWSSDQDKPIKAAMFVRGEKVPVDYKIVFPTLRYSNFYGKEIDEQGRITKEFSSLLTPGYNTLNEKGHFIDFSWSIKNGVIANPNMSIPGGGGPSFDYPGLVEIKDNNIFIANLSKWRKIIATIYYEDLDYTLI